MLVSPVGRVAVGVPGGTVLISVILFIPLPFVTAAIVTGLARIGFWGTTIVPSFVARRTTVLELPTWGGPRPTFLNITTGWRGARTFTAVGRALLTIPVTVITVTVITTFVPTVVIGATLREYSKERSQRYGRWTHIIVSSNSDCLATKVLSIKLLCSTISILARLVLQDTVLDISNLFIEHQNQILTRHRCCRDLCQRRRHFRPRDRNP